MRVVAKVDSMAENLGAMTVVATVEMMVAKLVTELECRKAQMSDCMLGYRSVNKKDSALEGTSE